MNQGKPSSGTSHQEQSQPNRREYFRIDDEIALSYKVVDNSDGINLDNIYQDQKGLSYFLMNRLMNIERESEIIFKSINDKSPGVAQYLSVINQKIDIIAKQLIHDQNSVQHTSKQMINISAGGIAFCSHEALEPGTILELWFMIYPSLLGIATFGKVVECRENTRYPEQGSVLIAVEFTFMKDHDREALMTHVFRKQAEDVRTRKNSDENQ